jgi:hypothetical protein
MKGSANERDEAWPALHLADWKPTCDTLHMWSQIVGKVRLALTPPIPHWWHAPLYLTARGLGTSPIPYREATFDMELNLVDHRLAVRTSHGFGASMPLMPRSVASFYAETLKMLNGLGIDVQIWPMPVEVPNPIRFDQDEQHHSYDPVFANRFFRVLSQTDRALKTFEGQFLGKQSPSHFFWGSFDLAQTRFSGRRAKERPGADAVTREAYSHEVLSFGFWPGTEGKADASFYAYAAPEPEGFKQGPVKPEGAFYSQELGEFVFPYEVARSVAAPREAVVSFFESVYRAGASSGNWDDALATPRRNSGKF